MPDRKQHFVEPAPPPRLALTISELAQALGCSTRHLQAHIDRLPAPIMLGQKRLWPVDAVRRWLAEGANS